MIRDGKFREDLFHRLNVVVIPLPPLRARREDIPVLVQYFLRKYAPDFGVAIPVVTSEAMGALQADSWPGNIRELENVTRRLLLEARGLSVSGEAVQRVLAARSAGASPAPLSLAALAADLLAKAQRGETSDAYGAMIIETERELLTQAITLAAGNQAKASRWLGLSRFTLREKLKQLGLYASSETSPE
jgi:DNA-binding NtrC family response regulator